MAWLEELYVAEEGRGRGTGTALVRAACVEATRRGCRAMELEVEASHQRVAALYRREGFRPLARSRWVRLLVDEAAVRTHRAPSGRSPG
jgi:ribosomal protein S18 acetylase RimI-like enzyme